MTETVNQSSYIRVSEVYKIYETQGESIEAVSGVSFKVAQGEFVAILGPSGCGKSTLLMMCAGLEPVTSGAISIGSTVVREPRAEVGIMFQDSTLLPWKTVLDNILFPVRVQKRPMAEYRKLALE